MDVLRDPNVRGYVIGATNVLFKQKKNLADILVEVRILGCQCAIIHEYGTETVILIPILGGHG